MKTIEGHDVKIFTDNIEENALEQIETLLSVDVFSDKKIRIMPDVHAGAGCVIGFTGNLGDKVIPNIVGVDIGCGMRVLKLGHIRGLIFTDSTNLFAPMSRQARSYAKISSVSSRLQVKKWTSTAGQKKW